MSFYSFSCFIFFTFFPFYFFTFLLFYFFTFLLFYFFTFKLQLRSTIEVHVFLHEEFDGHVVYWINLLFEHDGLE